MVCHIRVNVLRSGWVLEAGLVNWATTLDVVWRGLSTGEVSVEGSNFEVVMKAETLDFDSAMLSACGVEGLCI